MKRCMPLAVFLIGIAFTPCPLNAQNSVKDKLESIVLDSVEFDDTDVLKIIVYLSERSRELNPAKTGIGFLLYSKDLPKEPRPRVSLKMENVLMSLANDKAQ